MTQPDDLPNFLKNRSLARRTRRAMDVGASRVVEELKSQGVVRAYTFLGFHCEPVVWLVTRYDTERDFVMRDGIPRDLVIQHLAEAGVRVDLAARAGVTVESEQTVDRDHGGDWRMAMQ